MDKRIMRSSGCLMMAASIACYSLSGAYAYKSNELRVTNTITTGDIDIAISEKQIADDGVSLEPFENDQIVVPGDTVSKIVSVQNLANDCYLRMKVDYTQPGEKGPEASSGSGEGTGIPSTEGHDEVIIEVPVGIYRVGTDIQSGTYQIPSGQKATFQIITYTMSGSYTEKILLEALEPYFTDQNITDDEKSKVRNEIKEISCLVDECSNLEQKQEVITAGLPELKGLLPSTYQEEIEGLDFVQEEAEEHDTSETFIVLETDQMMTVRDGLKLVRHSGSSNVYELNDLYLNGISDDWVKAGDGYFYYKNIVKTGETVRFFDSVSFPTEWTEEFSGLTCGLDVTSEAVQSANFTPDFTAEKPWGDTEIELCVHENDGTVTSKTQNKTQMTVSLDATAAQLVTDAKDFFSNFDELMPGDTVSDTLHIRNQNDHDAEIFFHTETPADLTNDQKDLLKNLQLTIQVNGKQVYEGDLESVGLNKKISLGTYAKNAEGTIDFSIHMPKEDKNIYAVRDTKVTWVFDCGWDDPEGNESYQAPKTGLDDHLYLNFMIAGTLLLVGGITLFAAGKKKEKTD